MLKSEEFEFTLTILNPPFVVYVISNSIPLEDLMGFVARQGYKSLIS